MLSEQKQQLLLSQKKKSNPSADLVDALTANLGSNQMGFQSEAMHDDKAKIAASIGHTGAFKPAVGQQADDQKAKAKGKGKGNEDRHWCGTHWGLAQ